MYELDSVDQILYRAHLNEICKAVWILYAGLEENFESRHVLWVSSSSILLARGHFCSSSLMILLECHLPGLLPTGQVSFKSYLPSKKIYLSWYWTGIFSSPVEQPHARMKIGKF